MTRAEIYEQVIRVLRSHNSGMAEQLEHHQPMWLTRPWDLPGDICHTGWLCKFDLRELKFISGSSCLFHDCHNRRNEELNEARAAWKQDQQNWNINPVSQKQKEAYMNPSGPFNSTFNSIPTPNPINSIAEVVKRNALTAAKRTAAKGVKDSVRKAICAASQASDNPALNAFAGMLDSPHGDAALGVIVGVVGTMALPMLPDKISGSSHVTELFNNLQTSGFEYIGNTAYTEIAEPIIGAIAGELMGYVAKMAALEAPAKPGELPGTENHGTEVISGFGD